ncbi:MAG: gluconate 2-dehydrogenase subunit 3 family protein [Ginsengibacter sp.]
MNRRTALRKAVIISAGSVILPSCMQLNKVTVSLNNISLTISQEKLVATLSNAIIPKTNFIGAADVQAHEFALMMVGDCYTPDVLNY